MSTEELEGEGGRESESTTMVPLSSVAVALESEPELENVVIELALEAVLPRVVPLPIHNLERNVLKNRGEES